MTTPNKHRDTDSPVTSRVGASQTATGPGGGISPSSPAEVVIAHSGTDFDGLASMFAARHLYPSAIPLLIGSPDHSVRRFLGLHGRHFPIEQAHDVHRQALRRVVLVDVQVPSRLGDFREVVADPRIEVHVYDHHPPTAEAIRGDLHVVERVGATTTLLISRLLARKGGPPTLSSIEATLYALGIYEETGSLLFPETTPRDARAVAWLLEQGANLEIVSDFTQATLRADQRELLRALLLHMETRDVHNMQVAIAAVECDRYVGEAAVVAHRIMDLERPDALFCAIRMGEKVYVVGRSRESGPDVATILEQVGGGGHPRAASASMPAAPLQEVVAHMWGVIERTARSPFDARELMSTPVQQIPLDNGGPTVSEAALLFARYGHSVLPVTHHGTLQGMLTRRDVDKALQHRLGDTSILAYVSAPAPTVSPDISATQLMRLMEVPSTNRVVITEDGSVVGIVTRKDVLEALHLREHPPNRDLEALERLNALPAGLQTMLKQCGEIADDMNMAVYVVGGFVRDVLTGRENLDVDLVVEGDGIAYARRLVGTLGGRMSHHDKFGTAVITLENEMKLDVASTRLEFYTRPAALPEVVGSTLRQDLYRRDFTINAMAIGLNKARFGLLVDYWGARRDLRDGVVRILHNLSFIDDPTRIFRAIKFEQRYHFRMEPHTERLLRQAVSSNLLEVLSPSRARDEFVQILSEARPVPAIARMAELRVLRLIHPRLQLSARVRDLLEAVTAVLAQYEELVATERLARWIIYFRALIGGLGEDDMASVAQRYRTGGEERRRLFMDRPQTRHMLRRLYRTKLLPSEIHRLLSPLPLEMVLYLLARAKARSVKEKIMHYLDRLRDTRPVVSGRVLRSWGIAQGPAMGLLLAVLFDAQLDGKIHDVEEARAWLEEKDIVTGWT